jgi:dienelactone hydrolase
MPRRNRPPWCHGAPVTPGAFQADTLEERHAAATRGLLPVTICRPPGDGPVPFVVLLHGCGGLALEAMWTPHASDMRLPDRALHGMRLGYDESATADARRQVLAFLGAHGLIATARAADRG